MKKVSKETLALIDKLTFEKYPEALKVSSKNLRDYEWDGFIPVAYYVLLEQPGADVFGFDGESEDDEDYQIVGVSFCMHAESGRIFFWEMNNHGEPNNVWCESDGEFVTDGGEPRLIVEVAREHELC
jgi:hypothetical protein